ncbi:MAG: ABC transporter substrate-binding protein [Treponema sp.]|nr:ABC transporter substrate-binding protein [Treponema sp.]
MKSIILPILMSFAAALPAQGQNTPLTIYGIRGPSAVGMILLFENPPRVRGFDLKLEALAQADLVAAKLISGEAKVGVLPPNVAAKIAASGRDIQIAAVIGTGMLSLLSADPSVQRIEDLRGKTVEVAGQGATPDYVFRRILLAHGLDPDRDLRLSYSLAYPEIAQSRIAGRVGIALLPEPFATQAQAGRPDLRRVGDVQDEWIKTGGEANYPMTALVVDGEFARNNRLVVQTILEALRLSTQWVSSHPAEAGLLVDKHDLGIAGRVAAAAIPRSNYVFIRAAEARPALESLFRAFLEYAPQSIGGSLPADRFYYR